MKKLFQTKGFYLLMALLMFVIAWLSYRNFGTITYTYRFTNEKRESDYRFFQYVTGDRIDVAWEGVEKAPVITTKKAGGGTAVMIEGYGLGGDTPVHTITLTYYVDLLMIKSKLPDLKLYWDWVGEYHVFSLNSFNAYRAAAGNNALIHVEEVSVDDHFNGVNLMRSLAGIVFGILALILILINCTIKWTKSGKRAMEFLDNIKSTYDAELWLEEKLLGQHGLKVYERESMANIMGPLFLGLLISVILIPIGMNTYLVYPLVFACIIAMVIWIILISIKSFKKLGQLLTDRCAPLALIIGMTGLYGTKQPINYRLKFNYAYQSLISICFYYMGEFSFALEHLDLVWEELPGSLKRTNYQVHYHMMRIKCLRMMEEEEQVRQEQALLEALFKKKPKLQTNVYGKMYQKQESLVAFIKAGNYKKATKFLNGELASNITPYQQVATHYDLWRVSRLTGDEKQMKISEDFIQQYGKDLFYYERVKREYQ